MENVAGYFRAGIEQGLVRATLEPRELARAFVALQNGLIHLRLVQDRAFSLADAAATAAELFVAGIVADEGD